MNTILQYIVVSTSCLSLLYIFYVWFFSNDTNFRILRFYLLTSIFLALLLPLNNYAFNPEISFFKASDNFSNPLNQGQPTTLAETGSFTNTGNLKNQDQFSGNGSFYWPTAVIVIYGLISFFFFSRLITQLLSFLFIYFKSHKEKYGDCILVYNNSSKGSFSFFKWIFIDSVRNTESDQKKIIIHETIHASQYHSLDLIITELLICVMWFNPVIWKLRKTIQLVHEYLADEGTLNLGIDKIEYQVLLVNKIAEEKLILFSSRFNHSLIKKRIAMMSTSKLNSKSRFGILVLVPLTIILFFGIACFNGCNSKNESQKNATFKPSNDTVIYGKVVAEIYPKNINVFYRGILNPVAISVAGVPKDSLQAIITKGKILYESDGWVVQPAPGPEGEEVTIKVYAKINNVNRFLGEKNFIVISIPDPVAEVAGRAQGVISLDELKQAGGVEVKLHNFDFDLKFKVTEFTISAAIQGGFTATEVAQGNKFTQRQLDIISQLHKNQRIIFENIKADGPDGTTRTLNSIVLKIL